VPEDDDAVLVLNGDVITTQSGSSVLKSYQQKKASDTSHAATIMVVPMMSPYGLVDTNERDNVVGFREKVELPYWINAGVYVFSRDIAPQLPDLGDHETETFPQLAQTGRISAVKSRAFWRSIDSFKDLREAEEYLSSPTN
jgi:NDP-sugar pyrophosphorylase family protein